MNQIPNIVEIIISAKSTTSAAWAAEKGKAEKAGAEAGNSFGAGFQRTMKTLQNIGSTAFVAGLVGAVAAGEKLESSQERLSIALTRAHSGMTVESSALDAIRKKMEGYGFTNDQVNDSLTKLTNVTGNANTAIALEQTAADLAAKKHVSLGQATDSLARAATGNTRALKEMGVTMATGATWAQATAAANKLLGDRINAAGGIAKFASAQHMSLGQAQQLVKDAANGSIPALNKLGIDVLPKSATAAQRMAEFSRIMAAKLGGDAAAAAETSAGKMMVLRAKLTDAGAAIGEKLLPYVDRLVSFVSAHVDDIIKFGGAFASLMMAAKIAGAVSELAKAFGILNVAMDANPAGAIVIAIMAIGTAFYIAWQKSAGFRDFIKQVGVVFITVGEVFVRVGKTILDTWMTVVGGIIHGAALAFGWVPGLGGKLKSADTAFQNLRKGVDNAFDGILGKMDEWKKSLQDSTNQSEKARGRVIADFDAQGKAALDARSDIVKYSDAIRINGVNSGNAQAARAKLIDDMKRAGVNAVTANKDVDAYNTAVRKNGVDSDAARGARQRLINDTIAAWKNSQQGKTDVDRLTTAIRNEGTNSDAARGARQRLIQDLTNAGVDAKTAQKLVDQLQSSINRMHGNTVTIVAKGQGAGNIYFNQTTGVGAMVSGGLKFFAAGGRVPGGYGGGDSQVIAAEPGEAVIDKQTTREKASVLRSWGVPGFAAGGLVGGHTIIDQGVPFESQVSARFLESVERSFLTTIINNLKKSLQQAATAAANVQYKVSGGVMQWKGVVDQALGMLGLSKGLDSRVLYQMQTESGGNPNVVNKWDSNWLAGHPSVGLMQVIAGTYAAYGAPRMGYPAPVLYGVSAQPLANVYAGINYALHRYGAGLMAGGMGIGSGKGYAAGGTASGWGTVGEFGRELVRFPGSSYVYPHGQSERMIGGPHSAAEYAPLRIEIIPGGNSAFEQFMVTALKRWVVVKGGGNVQKAFGRH